MVKLTKLVYYAAFKINIFHTPNLGLAVVTVIVTIQIFTKLHIVVKAFLIHPVKFQAINQQYAVLNILLMDFVKFVQNIAQISMLVPLGILWNAKKFANQIQFTLVIWTNAWAVIILVKVVQPHLITVLA